MGTKARIIPDSFRDESDPSRSRAADGVAVTSTTRGFSFWRHSVAIVSLMATPLLLFISSTNTLYLRNQKEFQHQIQVLIPFIGYFSVTLAVGIALYALSKYRPLRWLLCAYYLAGPFFLVFGFLQNWSMGFYFFLWVFDTWAGVLVYLAAFLAATAALSSRLHPSTLATPFAAFVLLLLTTEAYSFATHFEPPHPETSDTRAPRLETPADLPNIYHIILDGYEAPFFPQTLSPEYRRALQGFVNFPNNVALYPSTNLSLPSIFSGKRRPGNISNPEYMRRAFNTDASFLYWLREAGYQTVAFTPKVYEFDLELFDHITYHQHNPRADALVEMNTATFKRLWLWANSPRLIVRSLLSTEWFIQYGGKDLRLVKNRNFLPFSVPITSYLSFLNVLDQEAELPARGRYTLIHLVIPHSPEVLASDCSYDDGGRQTGQLEQSGCATKLLVDFVERLKELGRFDDSLIIAHGDHGAYNLAGEGATHSAERVSLRALLLIKPIDRHGELAVSDMETTVVDVAPTLLKAVGVNNHLQAEGSSLLEAMPDAPLVPLD